MCWDEWPAGAKFAHPLMMLLRNQRGYLELTNQGWSKHDMRHVLFSCKGKKRTRELDIMMKLIAIHLNIGGRLQTGAPQTTP